MRAAIIVAVGLLLAACTGQPQQDRLVMVEGIVVLNQAGALLAKGTLKAGESGLIGWREACKVEQYGRLAKRISDEALVAIVRGDLDDAETLIESARDAMNGIGEEAARLAADNCAGEG